MLKKTKAFFGLTSGQEVEPWDLDLIVFQSEGIDTKGNKYKFPIRIRDLLDGTVIFGQSGGGKTSASVATVVREALKKGFGAVCTTVKPGDAMFYKNLAIEAGREKDDPGRPADDAVAHALVFGPTAAGGGGADRADIG